MDQIDKMNLEANKARRGTEDVVTEIGKDPTRLYGFAKELRMQDLNDQMSLDFLQGQVKPQALVDIFMAQKWESNHFNPHRSFNIAFGEDNNFLFANKIDSFPRANKKSEDAPIFFVLRKNGVLIQTFQVGKPHNFYDPAHMISLRISDTELKANESSNVCWATFDE